ncbi:MAG: hypothetical protein HOE90_16510 [Bacteriovoracaceae bacterium]|jgi:hypothetical protein|nr:hypothetical protein [Bacteriovoracaceae bacterium]
MKTILVIEAQALLQHTITLVAEELDLKTYTISSETLDTLFFQNLMPDLIILNPNSYPGGTQSFLDLYHGLEAPMKAPMWIIGSGDEYSDSSAFSKCWSLPISPEKIKNDLCQLFPSN